MAREPTDAEWERLRIERSRREFWDLAQEFARVMVLWVFPAALILALLAAIL